MNNQKKKELIERMITTLKDAADNPREGVSSICDLGIPGGGRYPWLSIVWKDVMGGTIERHFRLLGYRCNNYPLEECYSVWGESDDNGTHWTHPVYGPKRIKLARQLIEILEKKLEEL
jgi:hypothetical protein